MTPRLFDRTRRWATLRLFLIAAGEAVALACAAAAVSTVAAGLMAGEAVLSGAALALAIAVAVAACTWVRAVWAEDFGMRYSAEVREALARHAIDTSRAGSTQSSLGVMSARMAGDLVAIKDWVSLGLSDGVAGCASALAGLAILFWCCGQIGVATAAALLALALVTACVAFVVLHRAWRSVRHARGRVAALIGDITLGAAALAFLDGGARSLARLNRRADQLRKASVAQRSAAALAQAPGAIALALAFGLAVVMQQQGVSGPISVAEWALFIFATGLVVSALAGLARACDAYAAFTVARVRLDGLAAEQAAVLSAAAPAPTDESVTLRVAESKHERVLEIVLDHQVYAVSAGTVRLITSADPMASISMVRDAALESPHTRYAGLALRSVPMRQRARRFAVVTPEIGLLRGTVAFNLSMHRRSASHEDMQRALALVGLTGANWALSRQINPFDSSLDFTLQSRLRLARAICGKPKAIFIADPGLLIIPDLQGLLGRIAVETGAAIVAAAAPAIA